MTQEEKQLLLQDLCARLPYEVKVWYLNGSGAISTVKGIVDDVCYFNENPIHDNFCHIETVKPYLRPMSSMTEEEYTKYRKIQGRNCDYGEATICVSKSLYPRILYDDNKPVKINVYYPNPVIQDWLNAHHFDYRGLIPMGLALEAPEEMYKF